MQKVHISSLNHRELEPYRTLREQTQHWKEGFFIAEGEKTVLRLLESDFKVVSFLMSQDWFDRLETSLTADRFVDAVVFIAPDDLLESIIGFPLHKSIMALGRIPLNPPLDSLAEIKTGTRLHVAVEGIADAENMGMIARNCAAFGVECLLTGGDSASPYLRRSVRVSVGTVFSLRIRRSENILEELALLKSRYDWCFVGTTPHRGVSDLSRFLESPDHPPLCLLFGSEAVGLSAGALELCDAHFSIPMLKGIDSLNVANALAAALYEATRHIWKRRQ